MSFDTTPIGNSGGGGTYFKPLEHLGSYVLMIEPTHYTADAPNPFKPGETRHELTGQVTVFGSPEALDANAPIELPNTTITNTYLAQDLAKFIGKVKAVKLAQRPNGPGKQPSWVWRNVEGPTLAKVKAYYEGREAAKADVPDYLREG